MNENVISIGDSSNTDSASRLISSLEVMTWADNITLGIKKPLEKGIHNN